MGIFTRRQPASTLTYTLFEHSRDYALDVAYASEEVADAYADFIVAEDEAGAFGEFGADHAREWPAWSARYLAVCAECGSPWMLFDAAGGDDAWVCSYCCHTAPADDGEGE